LRGAQRRGIQANRTSSRWIATPLAPLAITDADANCRVHV
jgi:hypothetical protein